MSYDADAPEYLSRSPSHVIEKMDDSVMMLDDDDEDASLILPSLEVIYNSDLPPGQNF